MPRPSLGIVVRRLLAIGWLSCPGAWPLPAHAADDMLLDDQVVPAQFQQQKKPVAAKAAEDPDDTFAYQGLTILQPGTSAGATKKQAVAELSLAALSPAAQQKAQAILKGTSLYRRLPTISFEVDRNVYAYFLKNPDVAVASWRAMGISKLSLDTVAPQHYQADAGDGSKGTVEVWYSSPEDTLICCEGSFKSPLLAKPIIARSLMRLRAKFQKDADGRMIATHTGDVFVEFPSQTVETVAKIISPVSHSIADKNFKQLTFYAHMMTVAMARQPGWVEAVAQRMKDIPEPKREEFLRLSASRYIAARQREAAKNGQHLSLDDVLRPLRITSTSTDAAAPPRVAVQPAGATAK